MEPKNDDAIIEVHTADNMPMNIVTPLVRTSSGTSTSSSVTSKCRICWIAAEKQTDLYQTCYCKGSVGKVHITCLEKWLQESRTDYCDLCFYQYRLEKVPRYTTWESLRPFWSDDENRKLCNELLATIPGITFLVILACSCCLLAIFALDDMSSDMIDHTYFLFKFVLMFCLLLIVFVYGTMFTSVVRDVIRLWYKWSQQQLLVRLIPSAADLQRTSIESGSGHQQTAVKNDIGHQQLTEEDRSSGSSQQV